MPDRRRIVINPDEPTTGDNAYGFYDRAHPHFGDENEIARVRRQMRGLRGREVIVKVHAGHKPRGQDVKRVTMQRTITLNRYSDIFGTGGVYGEMMHEIRENFSEEKIVAYSVDLIAA